MKSRVGDAPRKSELKTVGTMKEVFEGKAAHTAGGLKASDLMKNARGRVVSRKRSEAAKKSYLHNQAFKRNMLEVQTARASLGPSATFHDINRARQRLRLRSTKSERI
jgi:hypothetical protein